jgi:hypothetical protein
MVPSKTRRTRLSPITYDLETDWKEPSASTRPIYEVHLLDFIHSDFGYLLSVPGGSDIIAFKLRH